jgi:predicted DNA-binding transcriptional regulator AlpA
MQQSTLKHRITASANPQFLTTGECCELLRRSRSWIGLQIRNNGFPRPRKLGKDKQRSRCLFDRAAVLAWVEARSVS